METQVSLDEKIRSTFGRALLEALSENTKAGGKGRGAASVQAQAVKIKDKRYNIMLVSLEGYPASYAARGPEALDQLQKDFYEIVEAAAVAHRGSIVKNTESTCLITFETSTDVLRAGLKIESTVARYNKDNEPINSKIVINTDEVVSEEWGELFKKFMNRVIQKEKIATAVEKAEKAAEPSNITAKREVNWGASKSEAGPKPAGSAGAAASGSLEPTTRTITEKRMASAPRTSVKVVTHKRELPEGAQQFSPHFIHSDMPVPLDSGPDWSHRAFLVVVTLLICAGGYFALKAVSIRVGERLDPLKHKLSQSASLSSSFIQAKFFSHGKNLVPVPVSLDADAEPAAVSAVVAPAASVAALPAASPKAVPAVSAPAIPAAVPVAVPAAAPVVLSVAAPAVESTAEKIARYRAVIRTSPNTQPAYQAQAEIGKIRVQQGQTALAKEIFNELLGMSPSPDENILAESHYQLGLAYRAEKDYASARWCFERVIKLFPRVAATAQESQNMLDALRQESSQE